MNRTKKLWYTLMTQLENVEFSQPEEFCPYSEVEEIGCDNEKNGQIRISYNGMYRFEKILDPLFENENITKEDKIWLNDLVLHYLLPLEFRSGASKKEYYIRKKMLELGRGDYGKEEKEIFLRLDSKKKYRIAEGLLRQEKIGESVALFGEICKGILQSSVLYRNTIDTKTLILCCGNAEKRNPYHEDEIELLRRLFLPIDYEIRIFTDGTIGILGEDITLLADQMVLF